MGCDLVLEGRSMILGDRLIRGIRLSREDKQVVDIASATWSLISPDGSATTPAEAAVNADKISALVQPTQAGINVLEFVSTLSDGQIKHVRLKFGVTE